MSRAVLDALESARKGFLRLALSAPIRRGSVDSMLTGAARAVEDLAATLDAGNDADELAEQVARVRRVAELWAGVVRALDAAEPGAVVLCKPCHAAQQLEPVALPAKVATDTCARCGESFVPVRAPCFCEGPDARRCSKAGWPADPCRCACHTAPPPDAPAIEEPAS